MGLDVVRDCLGLALIGILQEIKPRSEARILSIVIYAVMGWIVLVAVKPLLAALGATGFAWLASGGVLYTVGIIFLPSTIVCAMPTASGICS